MELVNKNQKFPLAIAYGFVGLFMSFTHFWLLLSGDMLSQMNKTYWYFARSAGFVSYELLTFSAILGVSSTSGIWDKLKFRPVFTQVHQYVSLAILPFLILHIWAITQDKSVPFTWVQSLVPLKATYQPIFTSLGILSLYGLVILIVSSYFRPKIGVKTWRKIHYISFLVYLASTAHGIFTGSDTRAHWALYLYVIPFLLMILFSIRRMFKAR